MGNVSILSYIVILGAHDNHSVVVLSSYSFTNGVFLLQN